MHSVTWHSKDLVACVSITLVRTFSGSENANLWALIFGLDIVRLRNPEHNGEGDVAWVMAGGH